MNGDRFMGRIFELSNERQATGRRKIKIVLREIFPSHDVWQEDGISQDEEYTTQDIEPVMNIPICVEFLSEEQHPPYGHGLTDIEDGVPHMEDVTMVGHCEKGYITDIEIDGKTKKVLIGGGYIDEMQCPKFIAWLAEKLKNGSVKGSVEIAGRPESDNRIIHGGGWGEYDEIPQIYDCSGHTILGIRPTDDTATIVELNNKLENSKEETLVDGKVVGQFVELVKTSATQTIIELNNKGEQYEGQTSESNGQLAVKDAEIAELNEKLATAQTGLVARDEAMGAQTPKLDSLKETSATLEKERKTAESNSALLEFSTEERALAQAEVDVSKADPTTVEINSITNKICVETIRKNKETHNAELSNGAPDIFEGVSSPGDKGDVDIFDQ